MGTRGDAGYCTGGGHGRWRSSCYDCSGAVSYVLGPKGAGILKTPEDSRTFARWGERAEASGWTARDRFGLHAVPENPAPTPV